jgi:hypothetical protein
MNLKGMWKIGSRESWWFNKKKCIYYVSLPELTAIRAACIGKNILRAIGFYATKCSCTNKPDRPIKFRLFRCRGCHYKG